MSQDMKAHHITSWPSAEEMQRVLADSDPATLRSAMDAAACDTSKALQTVARDRVVNPDFFRRVFTV